ncbi:FixH family protein [Cohnella sp. JJ-181]|uniref:FixH family protein n=1 Tax=Cohnella rhizoplanae TaxID=2974897 RepID=UPI0022FFBD5A|nr:FixH family protein [Cohnella sp. JJ-181]CAI6034820.1 hypothetical protein COHCIP112018_00850 [Cohnella sp. JJ-181]
MGLRLKRTARPAALVAAVGLALWYVYSSRASALPAETSSRGDAYAITLISPAISPSTMEPSRFVVKISDSSGSPVRAGTVALKYWMPGMFCGVFTAEAAETGRTGEYEAIVVPVMAGRWVLEAQAAIDDREVSVRHPFRAGRHA